jgi:DNA-binding GntR family transcriptional regulator
MAVLPEKEVYQSLHIDSGQPIFFHRTILYDKDDVLMGVVDTYYRGDMFSYTAQMNKK